MANDNRAKSKKNDPYVRAINERIRNDRIFLNNPVVLQGLGLAPIVVADVDCKSAFLLIAAIVLLLVPTRLVTVVLLHITGNHGRTFLYPVVAALLYIPAYLLLLELFGTDLLILGIYLPLLVADPLIISRSERIKLEEPSMAVKHGFSTLMGASLVILLMGALREFLATGTLYGNVVYHGATALLPLASQPAGGFILLGLVCAVWRAMANRHRSQISMEVDVK